MVQDPEVQESDTRGTKDREGQHKNFGDLHRTHMIEKNPDKITEANLNVVVMPNGEVICLGKTIGWVDKLGKYLTPVPERVKA